MSNTEKELTVEEMKTLLDSIEVKYRSNATKSTLKHLISKHKAKVAVVTEMSQNEVQEETDLVESNVNDDIISVSGNSDSHYDLSEQEIEVKDTFYPDKRHFLSDNVEDENTLSEANQRCVAFVRPLGTGIPVNNEIVNTIIDFQNGDEIQSETSSGSLSEVVVEKELPERLVVKRNVLKTFIEDLFTAGRSGYTLSNERNAVSIMDMPWRTVLVKGDTGNVQPLVDPAIKIKVKTYKSKDFINELLHFARYGARIGAIKNITIDSGHYVFEVLVDKEYVLRKNKDYYSGRV